MGCLFPGATNSLSFHSKKLSVMPKETVYTQSKKLKIKAGFEKNRVSSKVFKGELGTASQEQLKALRELGFKKIIVEE